MGALADHEINFILSAGRTGTVFLTRSLSSHFDEVCCVHEPPGSRALIMGGNARNLLGPGTGILARRFRRGLERRLAPLPAGTRYIEINPMMVSLTDILADSGIPFRVLHLTREPRSWVRSMRKFKASGFRRHIIDNTPFASAFPVPRPPGFYRASQVEKAMWRWRYSNERILELIPHCRSYQCLRYEDLFDDDETVRLKTMREILAAVGLESDDLSWFETEQRINPAPPGEMTETIDDALLDEICGPLMDRFGYPRRST
jgi:hypothetical protein